MTALTINDDILQRLQVRAAAEQTSIDHVLRRFLDNCAAITPEIHIQLLQSRLRLSDFALTHSIDELMQKTLDEAELLTGSQIGFFHFLDADQQNLSLQAWSTNTLNHMCTAEGKGLHYPVEKAGVWADCILERQPVIHNDYAHLTHRKGLPEGHAPVLRELVVPIMREGIIVAILGVGNKTSDYTETDIEIVVQLAAMTWDIVARKRVEEDLHRSAEIIALKDRFITTVSHEFRTPLAIIQTASNLLMHYADRITPERRQKSFEQIDRQIALLTGMLDDVLTITWTQTGKIEFRPKRMHLEPFCNTVLSHVHAPDQPDHQFKLVSSISDRQWLIDPHLLERILLNVLSNAVKYSPEHSQITLTLEAGTEHLIIRVQDEGVGIPEEDIPFLFEPFHRGKNVGNIKGVGLGLYIAKKYADLHGARIEVQSAVGGGTTVSVILPV